METKKNVMADNSLNAIWIYIGSGDLKINLGNSKLIGFKRFENCVLYTAQKVSANKTNI